MVARKKGESPLASGPDKRLRILPGSAWIRKQFQDGKTKYPAESRTEDNAKAIGLGITDANFLVGQTADEQTHRKTDAT